MNDREVMLKRVQICDFAINDAALYLDSNPDDQMALEYFRKYQLLRDKTRQEYVERFGPLSWNDYNGGDTWKWVDGPWPWQE